MNSKINFESKAGVTFLTDIKINYKSKYFLIKGTGSDIEAERDQWNRIETSEKAGIN